MMNNKKNMFWNQEQKYLQIVQLFNTLHDKKMQGSFNKTNTPYESTTLLKKSY